MKPALTPGDALAICLGFAAVGAVVLMVMLAGSAVVSWLADRLSGGGE